MRGWVSLLYRYLCSGLIGGLGVLGGGVGGGGVHVH
jgi:hypothetical protein